MLPLASVLCTNRYENQRHSEISRRNPECAQTADPTVAPPGSLRSLSTESIMIGGCTASGRGAGCCFSAALAAVAAFLALLPHPLCIPLHIALMLLSLCLFFELVCLLPLATVSLPASSFGCLLHGTTGTMSSKEISHCSRLFCTLCRTRVCSRP